MTTTQRIFTACVNDFSAQATIFVKQFERGAHAVTTDLQKKLQRLQPLQRPAVKLTRGCRLLKATETRQEKQNAPDKLFFF